jgi:hypothetical protein
MGDLVLAEDGTHRSALFSIRLGAVHFFQTPFMPEAYDWVWQAILFFG